MLVETTSCLPLPSPMLFSAEIYFQHLLFMMCDVCDSWDVLLGCSHTTISSVYIEWCEKQKKLAW